MCDVKMHVRYIKMMSQTGSDVRHSLSFRWLDFVVIRSQWHREVDTGKTPESKMKKNPKKPAICPLFFINGWTVSSRQVLNDLYIRRTFYPWRRMTRPSSWPTNFRQFGTRREIRARKMGKDLSFGNACSRCSPLTISWLLCSGRAYVQLIFYFIHCFLDILFPV